MSAANRRGVPAPATQYLELDDRLMTELRAIRKNRTADELLDVCYFLLRLAHFVREAERDARSYSRVKDKGPSRAPLASPLGPSAPTEPLPSATSF